MDNDSLEHESIKPVDDQTQVGQPNEQGELSVRARRKLRKLHLREEKKQQKLLSKRNREEADILPSAQNPQSDSEVPSKKQKLSSESTDINAQDASLELPSRSDLEEILGPLLAPEVPIALPPLISVITPVYNAKKWVDSCIRSAVESIYFLITEQHFPLEAMEIAVSKLSQNPPHSDVLREWTETLKNYPSRQNYDCPPAIVELCLFNDQSTVSRYIFNRLSSLHSMHVVFRTRAGMTWNGGLENCKLEVGESPCRFLQLFLKNI